MLEEFSNGGNSANFFNLILEMFKIGNMNQKPRGNNKFGVPVSPEDLIPEKKVSNKNTRRGFERMAQKIEGLDVTVTTEIEALKQGLDGILSGFGILLNLTQRVGDFSERLLQVANTQFKNDYPTEYKRIVAFNVTKGELSKLYEQISTINRVLIAEREVYVKVENKRTKEAKELKKAIHIKEDESAELIIESVRLEEKAALLAIIEGNKPHIKHYFEMVNDEVPEEEIMAYFKDTGADL